MRNVAKDDLPAAEIGVVGYLSTIAGRLSLANIGLSTSHVRPG